MLGKRTWEVKSSHPFGAYNAFGFLQLLCLIENLSVVIVLSFSYIYTTIQQQNDNKPMTQEGFGTESSSYQPTRDILPCGKRPIKVLQCTRWTSNIFELIQEKKFKCTIVFWSVSFGSQHAHLQVYSSVILSLLRSQL